MSNWMPAAEVTNFNPNRFDFIWNDDFSQFQPVALLWWDDVSYAAYQASDNGDDGIFEESSSSTYCAGNWGVRCEDHDDLLPF